ncbi:4-oxalocrotonate tautomerase family protein [Kitasatospora sp. NPDC101157]|uniref:tautomerase family protein n=1 Tax=Kitasatospora sp. NPDC101157 TaxID=3364098 RepID=UPI003820AC63
MPITVTAPRGVFTSAGEREILPQLTAVLAEAGGLAGNPAFTSMVGGTIHLLDPRHVYAGGVNRPVVMVELKLPDLGLATAEARAAFIRTATDVVERLSVDGHRRDDTWVNILNARDGAWGIGGRALTNDDLVAAISAAG